MSGWFDFSWLTGSSTEQANLANADIVLYEPNMNPEQVAEEVCGLMDEAGQSYFSQAYDNAYYIGSSIFGAVKNTFSFATNTLEALNHVSKTSRNVGHSTSTISNSLDQLIDMTDAIGQGLFALMMKVAPEVISNPMNARTCEKLLEDSTCEKYEDGTGVATLIASAVIILKLKDLLQNLKKSKNHQDFEELIRQGHAVAQIKEDNSLLYRMFGKAQNTILSAVIASMAIHYSLPVMAIFGLGALPILAPIAISIKNRIFGTSPVERKSLADTTRALRDLQAIQERYQQANQQKELFDKMLQIAERNPETLPALLDKLTERMTPAYVSTPVPPKAEQREVSEDLDAEIDADLQAEMMAKKTIIRGRRKSGASAA